MGFCCQERTYPEFIWRATRISGASPANARARGDVMRIPCLLCSQTRVCMEYMHVRIVPTRIAVCARNVYHNRWVDTPDGRKGKFAGTTNQRCITLSMKRVNAFSPNGRAGDEISTLTYDRPILKGLMMRDRSYVCAFLEKDDDDDGARPGNSGTHPGTFLSTGK